MPERSDIHKFSIFNCQFSIPKGFVMKASIIRITLFGLVYMLLSSSHPAVAAEGNISNTEKYAWSENAGWLNFRPADGGVTVHDTYLSGYAWGENLGWIKLGADSGGPYTNSDFTNWGVNCNPSGALSGYAWSENVGWINFNPSHSQVTYDTAIGSFDGYAWGENVGWIHFKGISPAYNVLSPRLAVAGVAVAEGAGPADFSISLSRETGIDVTVDYATQDGTATEGSDYTATSGTATIPAGSTSASVEVPVTDDSEAESDETFVLVLSTPDGASIATRQATGTITSEDAAGITVSPTAGLTTTEAGATASFEVVLESEPAADVTLGVSSSDTTEGTASPADLVFTSGNWNTPQEVTVTGVDDAAVDGDQEYTIGTAQAVSADPNYSGVDPADVSVTNTDDDVAGHSAGHHTLYVVTAGTGSGTVTSEPSGINCGKYCRQAYAADTSVLLTAAADDASVFVGWDGRGCSGTGSCTVTLDGDTTVTAQFEPQNSQGCTYSISPLNQFVAAGEGDGSVTVTAQDGCKWTAVSNTPWITVTSGVTGAGSGVVGYDVSENTETKARTGQMTVAGNVLTVMQAGTAETSSIKILWVKSDGTVVLTAVDADGNLIEPET
ncbi:MAG: hypothetical protein KAV87_44425, partial [Desulfobacteraceae bacterium]|nr:hypothetical protein [Desulfobacteraceae bacterium]